MLIVFAALTQLIACGKSNDSSDAPDYSDAYNWQTLPENASQPVDVLFFYPTAYFPDPDHNGSDYAAGWNQTIEQARADPNIQAQVDSKSSVFYKAGTNLYVPYYRQAAGADVLNALLWQTEPQNSDAANTALEIAYQDIENAFDYYLRNYNKDSNNRPRPFILAGHSQGSNLLLMLLERRFSDTALREQLVVAYVIGWSVTADDMSTYPALSQLGICSSSTQTGCVVTYNTQQNPGDFSQSGTTPPTGIVQANSYSVNPLTWVASNPNEMEPAAAPATANLGALFYKFQPPPVNPQLGPPGTQWSDQVAPGWGTYLIGGVEVQAVVIADYTGAQNNHGALVIDPTVLPTPGNYQNLNWPYNGSPNGWYHDYDYSFFFFNLEQNVIDRIASYNAGH